MPSPDPTHSRLCTHIHIHMHICSDMGPCKISLSNTGKFLKWPWAYQTTSCYMHWMCISCAQACTEAFPHTHQLGLSNPGFPAVCSKRLGSDQSQITQARLPVLRSPASIRADAYEDIVALISGKHPGVIRLLVQLESLVHITLPRTHHQQAAIGGCCWYQIPRRLHLLKHLQ